MFDRLKGFRRGQVLGNLCWNMWLDTCAYFNIHLKEMDELHAFIVLRECFALCVLIGVCEKRTRDGKYYLGLLHGTFQQLGETNNRNVGAPLDKDMQVMLWPYCDAYMSHAYKSWDQSFHDSDNEALQIMRAYMERQGCEWIHRLEQGIQLYCYRILVQLGLLENSPTCEVSELIKIIWNNYTASGIHLVPFRHLIEMYTVADIREMEYCRRFHEMIRQVDPAE